MTLIEAALSQWGEAERIGTAFNPRIAEYLATCGLGPSDEQPWCGAFMTFLASRCGITPPLLPAVARSWLTVGHPVTDPKIGDIVVLGRGERWEGHVGLLVRFINERTEILILGGNQADRVGVAPFNVDKVIGYRRLTDTGRT